MIVTVVTRNLNFLKSIFLTNESLRKTRFYQDHSQNSISYWLDFYMMHQGIIMAIDSDQLIIG
jgi:hypothetical protein